MKPQDSLRDALAPEEQPTAPRVAPPEVAAAPTRKRQIWDIDGDGEAEDAAPPEAAAPQPQPQPQPRPARPKSEPLVLRDQIPPGQGEIPPAAPPPVRPVEAREPVEQPRPVQRTRTPEAPAAPAAAQTRRPPLASAAEPAATPAPRAPQPPRQPAPQPAAEAPKAEAPKAEAPTPRPRARANKTRILGFHAGEMAADVMAGGPQPAANTGIFPTGWLVVTEGPGRGTSFTLGSGVSTIGRAADQTVCLDFGDMSVSRENHASVAFDDEQSKFFIGQSGKSNVVRRNGNPVLATEELSGGDTIRIGKTTLLFVALCGADFTWGSTDDDDTATDG